MTFPLSLSLSLSLTLSLSLSLLPCLPPPPPPPPLLSSPYLFTLSVDNFTADDTDGETTTVQSPTTGASRTSSNRSFFNRSLTEALKTLKSEKKNIHDIYQLVLKSKSVLSHNHNYSNFVSDRIERCKVCVDYIHVLSVSQSS